jgi:hypothetical protein
VKFINFQNKFPGLAFQVKRTWEICLHIIFTKVYKHYIKILMGKHSELVNLNSRTIKSRGKV